MHTLGLTDRFNDAQTLLAELQEQAQKTHVPAIAFAFIYQGLGEKDKGFDWLEKAAGEPHCLTLELYSSSK